MTADLLSQGGQRGWRLGQECIALRLQGVQAVL